METNQKSAPTEEAVLISPIQMLTHWQGHRSLTRRAIEIFPEKEFYEFSIGGMRPFAQLCMELIDIAGAGVRGMATGDWSGPDMNGHPAPPATKAGLLALWDADTEEINKFFPLITLERFQEHEAAFGMYEAPIYSSLLYFIDNEIHHRAQAYVYLRALGVEPPAFWERPR
ncbi:DinB family protein [Dyadobacter tibetensis]|uniref:DinB family protein n=1 Tax=Dyadobacter tibetensis TaxID=1211851 RepID=UPI00046E9A78|nr:DinB family protein [Dyadobacter tibetensis]